MNRILRRPAARTLVPIFSIAVAGLLVLPIGCASNETTTRRPPADSGQPSIDPNESAAAPGDHVEAMVRDLDNRYVVGLRAARQLGYRIDWQTDVIPSGESGIRRVDLEGDSIFVLDGHNFLSRVRVEDGAMLWRLPVAEPIQEVLGINYVPELERVYLTLGGALLVLDSATGAAVGRQRLQKAASTEPLMFGPYMIYGARNGQLVWHSHQVAFQADAYQVSGSIDLKPVMWGPYIAAVGGGGRVRLLHAGSVSTLWAKELLDEVVAPPQFGDGILYIAALDQYLYAVDADSGRTIWRRLTTSPLSDSPTVLDGHVYQQIPGEGLTCFDALSLDNFDGQVIWQTPGLDGNVLMQRSTDLLVWDDRGGRMSIVDPQRGGVIGTVPMPMVERLITTSKRDGELYAQARDGRVTRLVPRN